MNYSLIPAPLSLKSVLKDTRIRGLLFWMDRRLPGSYKIIIVKETIKHWIQGGLYQPENRRVRYEGAVYVAIRFRMSLAGAQVA